MTKKFSVDKKPDREVNIYAETANSILEKCYQKAEIKLTRGRYGSLEKALDKALAGNHVRSSYIKSINTKVQLAFKTNKENQIIRLDYSYINLLAKYAGIEDYDEYDKRFKSYGIPVLYAPEPFKLFNLVRVTDNGHLRKTETAWEFINQHGDKMEGEIQAVEIYIMTGDKDPKWIKVSYISNEIFKTAYFAELPEPVVPVQSVSGRLFTFFQKYLKD